MIANKKLVECIDCLRVKLDRGEMPADVYLNEASFLLEIYPPFVVADPIHMPAWSKSEQNIIDEYNKQTNMGVRYSTLLNCHHLRIYSTILAFENELIALNNLVADLTKAFIRLTITNKTRDVSKDMFQKNVIDYNEKKKRVSGYIIEYLGRRKEMIAYLKEYNNSKF